MKIVILFFLLLIADIDINNTKISTKNFLNAATKRRPIFIDYKATVYGGGFIKNSVRVYNELGQRIFRAKNGIQVHPTGEIKILTTPQGERKCHRLLEEEKLLIEPKKADNISIKELWIPTEHLKIDYPTSKLYNGIIGNTLKNSSSDGSSLNWALNGEYKDDSVTRYDELYNPEKGIIKVDMSKNPTTFIGLRENWKDLVKNADIDLINDLEHKAAKVTMGTLSNDHSEASREFRRALTKVVISEAGFKILKDDEDNRFQVHIISEGFFGSDHWAISVKMGDGVRNYIQKQKSSNQKYLNIPFAGNIHYNCDMIWGVEQIAKNINKESYKLYLESFNVLSLKRNHLDVLAQNIKNI